MGNDVLCEIISDAMKMSIHERVGTIFERVASAARRAGRGAGQVRLVAVGKTQSPDRIREAAMAGVRIIGENYIQEARDKFDALGDLDVYWHFIGHLQSNKARYAVRLFDLIHSVDSLKLAAELNKQAAGIRKIQNILVQVNISGEATKWGADRNAAKDLVERIGALEHLRVKGLMTMPPIFDVPDLARPYFAALRELAEQIDVECDNERIMMEELSMGMTGDFEAAIEEGATLVRIGTAIFGARQ
jgi:pyridoxal phosphate enzyme (YggS family)